MKRLRNFVQSQGGATAVEYGLLCALLSIVVVAAVVLLSEPVEGLYGFIAAEFDKIELGMGGGEI